MKKSNEERKQYAKQYAKKYYEKNREKILSKSRDTYQKNKKVKSKNETIGLFRKLLNNLIDWINE